MRSPTRFALASGILLLVGLVPTSSAVVDSIVHLDDFESYAAATLPSTSDDYTFSGSTVNTFISTAQAHSPTKSLKVQATTANGYVNFDYGDNSNWVCSAENDVFVGPKIWLRMDAYPTTGEDFVAVGTQIAPFTQSGNLRLDIDSNGMFDANIIGGAASQNFALMPLNTWVDLSFHVVHDTDSSCTTSGFSVEFASDVAGFLIILAGNNYAATDFDNIGYQSPTTTTRNVFLDDLSAPITVTGAVGGPVFCSNIAITPENPAEPHEEWGYEYTDGIRSVDEARDTGDVGVDISMDDGFFFDGDTSLASWDFLAKNFPTGSKAMHTAFQIEASSTDFVSSRFRAAYTLDNAAAPTDTTRGDGLVTQEFTNHVEVEVTETGNNWQVQVYYAEPTVNGGARTALGQSVPFGSANDPTSFMFWFDSRIDANPGEAKNLTQFGTTGFGFAGGAGDLQDGPYIAVTVPDDDDVVANRDQLVVAFRSLRFGPGPGNSLAVSNAVLDSVVNNQWFIGYGTSGLTGAETALNDNKISGEDSDDSTCVWDDTGTAVAGAQGAGTAPGSSVTQPGGGGGDGGLGGLGGDGGFPGLDIPGLAAASGMSEAAFQGFAAILFMIILGATFGAFGAAITGGKGNAATVFAGIGAVGGLGMDAFFGLIPLWLLALLGVLVIAAIVFIGKRR